MDSTTRLPDFHDCGGHYRGSGKINLEFLTFDGSDGHLGRSFNESQVQRLVRAFEREGCHPEEPQNQVPVIIPSDSIEEVLQRSDVTRADFVNYTSIAPQMILINRNLRCIRGRHRIEAAKKLNNQGWWVADFYSEDLPAHYVDTMKAKWSHTQRFGDGDIYRNVHYFEQNSDWANVEVWLNRLGPKRADFKTLGKSPNILLKSALDDLIPLIGLWADFKAGMLKRVLTMKCLKEFARYLRHLKTSWVAILQGYEPWHLDSGTVRFLQLLAPRSSSNDCLKISAAFRHGKVFPTLSEDDRCVLLERVLAHQGRIPSLVWQGHLAHNFSQSLIGALSRHSECG